MVEIRTITPIKKILPTKVANIFTESWTETRTIDLNPLIKEKAELEVLLEAPEPTDEEFIELGRLKYQEDGGRICNELRLEEINKTLEQYG